MVARQLWHSLVLCAGLSLSITNGVAGLALVLLIVLLIVIGRHHQEADEKKVSYSQDLEII